jgi:hypothetical protein
MSFMQTANLALSFGMELCALAAFGYWGIHTGGSLVLKAALGIGAPLAAAVLWGAFGSPRASIPLHGALRLVLEVLIFGGAVVVLARTGQPTLAWIFAVLLGFNRFLLYVWKQ